MGAFLAAAAATSPAFSAPANNAPVDKFSATLSAKVEHQTNISGVSDIEAKLRGVSTDDTTYTPNLNVTVNMPVGRQLVYLNGNVGYLYHDKNKIYDSERIAIDGGVRARVSVCAVDVGGTYQRALSSFDDIVIGPTIDNILETKGAHIQATCARRTGFGLTGAISTETAQNDTSLLKVQDYTRNSYMLGVSYSKPRLGVLTVFGTHARTEYDNRGSGVGVGLGLSEGYESDTGGLTYERHLGARIDGSVTVSYTSVSGLGTPVPGAPSDFDGVTYLLTASYKASQRLRGDVSFGREVTPSNRFGNSYDLATRYTIRGSYDLGSRISTNLGYEQRETDSKGSPVLPGILTNSTVKVVSGGITYKMSRRVGFSLDAGYEKREANDPRFEYDNTRVGLTADVTY
jgi:hypothetical protein